MSFSPLGEAGDFPADPGAVRDYGEAVAATGALILKQVDLLRGLAAGDRPTSAPPRRRRPGLRVGRSSDVRFGWRVDDGAYPQLAVLVVSDRVRTYTVGVEPVRARRARHR